MAWGVAVLVSSSLGWAASAQDRRSSLANHARAVRDSGRSPCDRVEHARSFVKAVRPEDWPLAFETIRDVAHHRDRSEVELVEVKRNLTGRVEFNENGLPIPLQERTEEKDRLESRRRTLEEALQADDAVLAVFRSSLTRTAARSDPANFAAFVSGLGRARDRRELAKNLRALGFFPTPAAREVVLAHLDDSDDRVVVAAVRALGDHAEAVTAAPAADSPWSDTFARVHSGLTQAWREREVRHRRSRALARKSAAAVNLASAAALERLEELKRILEIGLSGSSLEEKKRKLLARKKRTARRSTIEKAIKKYEKALEKHEEAGRKLRAQDREISAFLATAGCVFDRMSAEQRAPIEASLAERLDGTPSGSSCLRLLELCGRLRSDAIGHTVAVATSAPAPEIRVAACLALGRQGRPEHVLPLSGRLGDPCWQVGIAALRALHAIGGRTSVEALVTALTRTEGRVREETNDALRQLTGENFHGDAVKWTKWWEQHGEHYQGPPDEKEPTASRHGDGKSAGSGGNYFGIRTSSRRILFILDASAAMELSIYRDKVEIVVGKSRPDPESRKIARALKALRHAITAMPENVSFNVLLYGDKVTAWKPDPVPALARNKKAARRWLARVKTSGGAAVFEALLRALDPAGRETNARLLPTMPDTIFLLAGGWTGGRELALEADIVEEVERVNRLAQVAIPAIAAARGPPTDFLRALAARCGGRFVNARTHIPRD